MAGFLSVLGRRHEPTPRMWHTSQQTRNKVLVHGGRTIGHPKDTKRGAVDVFDTYTELWQQKKTTGKTPAPDVYLTASASLGDDLFTFGGWDGNRRNDSLHRLHRLEGGLEWIELSSRNKSPESPMAKEGAGMVAFGDNLAVYGGYGRPPGPTQPGSSFVRDTREHRNGEGWTNEFHIYNLEKSMLCDFFVH